MNNPHLTQSLIILTKNTQKIKGAINTHYEMRVKQL
jgi:hypothetical protein